MIVSIRQLNAFGNVLQSQGRPLLAKDMHGEVQRMLKHGLTEVDLESESEEGKKLCSLIQRADGFIHFLKTGNHKRNSLTRADIYKGKSDQN